MKKRKKEDTPENTDNENITIQETTNNQTEETTLQTDENTDEQAKLQERCEDLADKNLRLMAEFDNYRKRTLREKSDLIKIANENVFVDMLPLIDDFERAKTAIDTSDDITTLREGVDLIYNKFLSFLHQKGIKAIETENSDFDVAFHEAITTFPAPTEEQKGKIIDCATKGYTLNEKVIRFSKVVVGE